jgi:hypothetical protein
LSYRGKIAIIQSIKININIKSDITSVAELKEEVHRENPVLNIGSTAAQVTALNT